MHAKLSSNRSRNTRTTTSELRNDPPVDALEAFPKDPPDQVSFVDPESMHQIGTLCPIGALWRDLDMFVFQAVDGRAAGVKQNKQETLKFVDPS